MNRKTGRDEVAEAGKTGEGFGFSTEIGAETGHFGESTCDQSGDGIVSQLKPHCDSGGDGVNIFDCSTELNAGDVMVCV